MKLLVSLGLLALGVVDLACARPAEEVNRGEAEVPPPTPEEGTVPCTVDSFPGNYFNGVCGGIVGPYYVGLEWAPCAQLNPEWTCIARRMKCSDQLRFHCASINEACYKAKPGVDGQEATSGALTHTGCPDNLFCCEGCVDNCDARRYEVGSMPFLDTTLAQFARPYDTTPQTGSYEVTPPTQEETFQPQIIGVNAAFLDTPGNTVEAAAPNTGGWGGSDAVIDGGLFGNWQ